MTSSKSGSNEYSQKLAVELIEQLERDALAAPPIQGVRRFIRDAKLAVRAFSDLGDGAKALLLEALQAVGNQVSTAGVQDHHREPSVDAGQIASTEKEIQRWLPRVRELVPSAALSVRDAEIDDLAKKLQAMNEEASKFGQTIASANADAVIRLAKAKADLATFADKVAEEAIESVRERCQPILDSVAVGAEQLVNRARQGVLNTSLDAAQEQFQNEGISLARQVAIWALIGIVALSGFFAFGVWLMKTQVLPKDWTWQILYYLGIRITLLSAVGAVATYALRMLTLHIDLRHSNSHRARISNSMAAFVEAARTEAQRDAILLKLVDCVITRDTGAQSGPDLAIGQMDLLQKLLAEVKSK